jgi:hypothetical protein
MNSMKNLAVIIDCWAAIVFDVDTIQFNLKFGGVMVH